MKVLRPAMPFPFAMLSPLTSLQTLLSRLDARLTMPLYFQPRARIALGMSLFLAGSPTGVSAGTESLIRALQARCSAGAAIDCRRLAEIYERDHRHEHAVPLLRKSCGAGDARSCALLGAYDPGGATGRAVSLVTRACEAGDALGCTRLADFHRHGRGVVRNAVRARELRERAAEAYERACSEGNTEACLDLAEQLESSGDGMAQKTRAVQLFDSACRNGQAHGCAKVGDHVRAVFLWRSACEKGDPEACHGLGIDYAIGRGVKRDEVLERKYFRKACDLGFTTACDRLGQELSLKDLHDGCRAGLSAECRLLGWVSESVEAAQWFRKACDMGDAPACFDLGSLGGANPRESDRVFRKACDSGYACGCVALGTRLEEGRSTKANLEQAVVWYEKACEMPQPLGFNPGLRLEENRPYTTLRFDIECPAEDGPDKGCEALARTYDRLGAPVRALTSYQNACDRGGAAGCYYLGVLYDEGKIVVEDKAAAARLFGVACVKGSEEGCRRIAPAEGIESQGPSSARREP